MSHGRRVALQGLLLAAVIVILKERSQGRAVIVPAFAKALGQTSHAFRECTNRQVVVLYVVVQILSCW